MTTAPAPDQLRSQIEIQRRVVDEAEQVVARRVEWDAEQQTTASRAGLQEARRDLGVYRAGLRRLEAMLEQAEAAEVAR
jgi:hypothetical protein